LGQIHSKNAIKIVSDEKGKDLEKFDDRWYATQRAISGSKEKRGIVPVLHKYWRKLIDSVT
jgi:hypothetical protein